LESTGTGASIEMGRTEMIRIPSNAQIYANMSELLIKKNNAISSPNQRIPPARAEVNIAIARIFAFTQVAVLQVVRDVFDHAIIHFLRRLVKIAGARFGILLYIRI
jgi:hypothetical protein